MKALCLWSLMLLLAACGRPPARQLSLEREAPDEYNTLNNFDIFKVFDYDGLLAKTTLTLAKVPWTDTYWPTEEAGLANRWTDVINPQAKDNNEEIGLGAFLMRYAGELAKRSPDPLLSPAEKYDMLYQARHGLTLPPAKLQALAAAISKQDQAIRAQPAIPAKLPLLQKMSDQLFSDEQSELTQAMPMTVNSWAGFLENNLNPKNRYLSNEKNPGDDWSWEGSCHGWAAAAVMAPPPKHAVMATIDSRRVFFSEGDLRGLMTKAWADAAPEGRQYFVGRRCYEGKADEPIPSNANGRGYSGHLQMSADSAVLPIIVLDTLPSLLPVKIGGHAELLTAYHIKLETTGEEKYLVEYVRGGGDPDAEKADVYWLANSFTDLTQALKNDDPLSVLIKPYAAQLTGCWDVNPATFHETLVEQLGVREQGFVMNRTRVGQVWNQPIYSVTFTIGDLQRVGTHRDVVAKYRASGSAYVAQVHASVSYTDEPEHPELSYDSDYDLRSQTRGEYDYTLEFDAQRRVIGGEWGTFTKIDPGAPSPDFLMGFPKGAQPHDQLEKDTSFAEARIDYTGIISKLLECSLSETTDGQLSLLGNMLAYTTCPIAKATN